MSYHSGPLTVVRVSSLALMLLGCRTTTEQDVSIVDAEPFDGGSHGLTSLPFHNVEASSITDNLGTYDTHGVVALWREVHPEVGANCDQAWYLQLTTNHTQTSVSTFGDAKLLVPDGFMDGATVDYLATQHTVTYTVMDPNTQAELWHRVYLGGSAEWAPSLDDSVTLSLSGGELCDLEPDDEPSNCIASALDWWLSSAPAVASRCLGEGTPSGVTGPGGTELCEQVMDEKDSVECSPTAP